MNHAPGPCGASWLPLNLDLKCLDKHSLDRDECLALLCSWSETLLFRGMQLRSSQLGLTHDLFKSCEKEASLDKHVNEGAKVAADSAGLDREDFSNGEFLEKQGSVRIGKSC